MAYPIVTTSAEGEVTEHIVPHAPKREQYSWALYDFANTIFSMNIATLYFNVWLISDLRASNTSVAIGNAISSLLVAASIPLFGAISDTRQRRVPWVIWLTIISVAATIGMGVVGQTMVPLTGDSVIGGVMMPAGWRISGSALAAIIAAFVIANYAYQGAQPFYNAMLPDLVPRAEQGWLSGLGAALGYIGSIVGVLLISPFFNGSLASKLPLSSGFLHALHTVFPFTSHEGRVSTFVPTGVMFLLFSLPLMINCRDHHPVRERTPINAGVAFRSLWRTLRDTERHPGALRFILTSFLYQDAIGTIITFMAVYAVKVMGFAKGAEIQLFIILTIPAVVGAYLAGRIVDRIGPKKTLMLVLAAWTVLLVCMMLAPSRAAFWVIGAGIGFIFGGVSTAERPLLLTLIPSEDAGRFFSLMVLSARAAAVVGPLVWATVVDRLTPISGESIAYRAAVGAVTLGFVLSLILLAGVPDRFRGRVRVAAGA